MKFLLLIVLAANYIVHTECKPINHASLSSPNKEYQTNTQDNLTYDHASTTTSVSDDMVGLPVDFAKCHVTWPT